MKRHNPTGSFWAALRHAFAIPESEDPSPEQRHWLEQIADKITQRGLAAPATFLLQSVKPMNFLGSQVLVFFKPIISLVVPAGKCDQAADLLSQRHSMEVLLRMIEERQERSRRANEGLDPHMTGR